jgi:hypothetical protein
MKYLLGTQQEMVDLKLEIFNLGAPFTAVLFGNYWDEETRGVYASSKMKGGTFALESEFPYEDQYALKHIDEYVFAPYTFQYYMDTYPDNEVILARIPKNNEGEYDEAWLDKTPQMWVSDVLIGDNYTVVDI